ncbi:MAG: hypothetical protein ACJ75T_01880 [Solirubrobacterales bacterium]
MLVVGTGTAQAADPIAETTGSPVRTATTAILQGRVDSGGASATYHFDYGTSTSYDQTTPDVSIGTTDGSVPVATRISGLTPGTTYHYRVVADNGVVVAADDFTFATRASDAPLSHGQFPGPPGSDRAWEMVSRRDLGDNPVIGTLGIAADGNSLMYNLSGGAPGAPTGSLTAPFAAKRTGGGWQDQSFLPPRNELAGQEWADPVATDDLSTVFMKNLSRDEDVQWWKLSLDGERQLVREQRNVEAAGNWTISSTTGNRVTLSTYNALDPDHAPLPNKPAMYDVNGTVPHMIEVLPDGSTACNRGPAIGFEEGLRDDMHWLSQDGHYFYFVGGTGDLCVDNVHLYRRDLDALVTLRLDPPPNSGADCGNVLFLRSSANWVYFSTSTSLTADDPSHGCTDDGDVYRIHPDGGGIECATCASGRASIQFPGTSPSERAQAVSIAQDDSRLYFLSHSKLTPDAPSDGGIYRVDLLTKDIALASPSNDNAPTSTAKWGFGEGPFPGAISSDGKVLIFQSASPRLNDAASDNGGNFQWYRYDDSDRSLNCISCRLDGAPTTTGTDLVTSLTINADFQLGPNLTPLSDDGTFMFATSEGLVAADQNTAAPGQDPAVGRDIYEWRDGRPLLISDGVHDNETLFPAGISLDGQNAFFIESRALTPEAPDDLARLYDARVGGGFDLAGGSSAPCSSVDECKGPLTPVPADPGPGSSSYSGPGNQGKSRDGSSAAHKKKKKKCRAKKNHHKCSGKKPGRK